VSWPRAERPGGAALTRAREIYRAQGLRATWFSALGEAGYRRLLAFERRLDRPVRGWASDLPLRVERLPRSAIEEYRTLRPDSPAATIRRRLAADEVCLVGRLGGRIVTAGWAVRGRVSIAYLGGSVELGGGEAYLYDWFTEPRVRGHGAGTVRLAGELRELREAGLDRALVFALPENGSAFGPLERMGFAPGGIVRAFRVGPRVWIRPRRGTGGRRLERPPHMRPPALAARARLAARAATAVWPRSGGVVSRRRWGAAASRADYSERGPLRAIVVHHTGIRPEPGGGARSEAAFLRRLQRLHLSRGWIDLGYHFVIMPSGRVYAGRPPYAIGAHAIGHNRQSLGVALAGDFDVERPTAEAVEALHGLLSPGVPGIPAAPVVPHCELADTRCPGRFLYSVVPASIEALPAPEVAAG
jgi:hypothetical protein